MKIQPASHRERGMAVVVVLALTSVLLVYVAANLRSLGLLDRELKRVEQKQIQRLDKATSGATNAVAVAEGALAN